MQNVFRPVSDSTILPERIYQGKSWKNISFGVSASIDTYKKHGLYLEVGEKPACTKYQTVDLVDEVIDHTKKEIQLVYKIVDLPPEKVAVIVETETKDAEKANNILMSVTLAQGDKYIDTAGAGLPAQAITILKMLLRLILVRT